MISALRSIIKFNNFLGIITGEETVAVIDEAKEEILRSCLTNTS
ncbi:MAG: hypothetical protein QXU18_10230 [Thermoplasmatales archaeon]